IGSSNTSRATVAGNVDWRPVGFFTGHLNVGVDHSSNLAQESQPPAIYEYQYNLPDYGLLSITNSTNDVSSVDLRGSTIVSLTPSLRSTTSLGFQIANTRGQGVATYAYGLTSTNFSLTGVPNINATQTSDNHATVGGYAEQEVGIAERLFLTAAIRLDG